MKNIRQTAHLHRLILKNRAHQLADDDAVVLVRPDAHRQLHDLHRLPGKHHVESFALLKDEQVHRMVLPRLDAVAVDMDVQLPAPSP